MRKEGYYWVRRGKDWDIGYWSGSDWALIRTPDEVDETPITRDPSSAGREQIETGMIQHNGETRKSEVEVIQEISDSFKNSKTTTFGESANSFVKE